MKPNLQHVMLGFLTCALVTPGCERKRQVEQHLLTSKTAASETVQTSGSISRDHCRLVLLPLGGETALDKEIARAQERVLATTNTYAGLEKLGWLFVAKARVSFDPGFHKL